MHKDLSLISALTTALFLLSGCDQRISVAEVLVLELAPRLCLGEEHGGEEESQLRIEVLSAAASRFPSLTVLAEFAAPAHQALLDRFVIEQAPMSRDELRPIWRDAGLGIAWEHPGYEEFLRAAQSINRESARPRVRIVGASLPIPWDQIHLAEDLVPWLQREKLVEAERLAAAAPLPQLWLFGNLHCERIARSWRERGTEGAAVLSVAAHLRDHPAFDALGSWMLVTPGGTAGHRMLGEVWSRKRLDRFLAGELADGVLLFPREEIGASIPEYDQLPPAVRPELLRRSRLWDEAQRLELGD